MTRSKPRGKLPEKVRACLFRSFDATKPYPAALKYTLPHGAGWGGEDSPWKLCALTSHGCYPLYYVDGHGETLCADCAFKACGDSDFKMRPADVDTHFEGPPIVCADCNESIESAYGDPGADS